MNFLKDFFKKYPERYYLISLGIFSLFFLVIGMNLYPLVDVDETRYAVMSRDLIGHNWNYLLLNGVPFIEKPPLYFWFTAASIKLFGFSCFAVRLPVAILSILTILFTYFIGKKIKTPAFGYLVSLIMMSNVFWVMLTRVAIIDMVFTSFLTWTMYFGILMDLVQEKYKKYCWLGFSLSLSLAFCAKGLLAIVFPVLILGAYKIYNKTIKDFFKPHYLLTLLVLFLLINLPWHVAMYKQYGFEFIWVYYILHHFERLVNADALGKTRPLLYFVPVFFIGFMPWSVAFIGSIVKFFKNKEYKDNMILIWALYFIIVFGLFSVASGKLPTYVLPAVPPAAFLVGYYIYNKSSKWLQIPLYISMSAVIIAIVALSTVVYNGGMNELVEYSKNVQNSEYHLITYDMPVKPSIFLNYKKDYADLILDNNIDDLKKAINNNKKSKLIVKNKNFDKDINASYIKDNFVLLEVGKKYSLYQIN